MSFEIKMLTGQIKVVTGLHIGSGNNEMHIGGTDNPVIKVAKGNSSEPYIPGSSLKGKLRSLLYLYTGSSETNTAEIIAKLFGISADDKKNKNKIEEIKTTRLSFWDCFLTDAWRKNIEDRSIGFTEVKMENTINRITGTAEHPRNTERVIPETEFDFKLTIKVFDDEDLLDVILGTMKLLEMDSLGGSGSRGYGKIKFENLQLDNLSVQDKFEAIKPFEKRFIEEQE